MQKKSLAFQKFTDLFRSLTVIAIPLLSLPKNIRLLAFNNTTVFANMKDVDT